MTGGLDETLSRFVERHRSIGILLDTNVLGLLVCATLRPDAIGRKRLQKYTPEDAVLLTTFVARFERILTTSHILAETSNLVGQLIGGKQREQVFGPLYPLFCLQEPGSLVRCAIDYKAIEGRLFCMLGLTDAGIASLAKAETLLLTDDLDRYLSVVSFGGHAVNFTHMREAAGLL